MSRQAVTSYKLLRRRPTVGSHTCNVNLFGKSATAVCVVDVRGVSPPGEAPHAMCQGRVCIVQRFLFVFVFFNYKSLKLSRGGS